ncbi:MAG: sigma-70 family RNA polymerase sigma factor [Microthrixaceae bacterium]
MAGEDAKELTGRVLDQGGPLSRAHIVASYNYALRLGGGNRHLAEDLAQQACEEACRALAKSSIDSITVGWLVVTVRRRFADTLRRKYRDRRRFSQLVPHTRLVDEPDWDAVGANEALMSLSRLPDDQRAALIFRYVDDLPLAEVAELLDRSPSATESLLARARRNLAALVTEVRNG